MSAASYWLGIDPNGLEKDGDSGQTDVKGGGISDVVAGCGFLPSSDGAGGGGDGKGDGHDLGNCLNLVRFLSCVFHVNW